MYLAIPGYYGDPFAALFGVLMGVYRRTRVYFAPISRYTREFDRITSLIEKQIMDGFVPVCEDDARSCAELLDTVRRRVNVMYLKQGVDAAKPWYDLEIKLQNALVLCKSGC